jgi:AraC-like DNA-binding protein
MSSKQIGSLLGLGEARVLRLFNMEVGKTLRRHLLEVRMARAAEFLKDGALPIKTIAFHCGYTIVNNFHRDFKNFYGTSPRQMRFSHMHALLHERKSCAVQTVTLGSWGTRGDELDGNLPMLSDN